MERSIYSLTYKGSIPTAIVEARQQKKLFAVYISGDDENSVNMERSTWVDPHVAEIISRRCIFLHLTHGSVSASQFSAIYPQQSFPSISAIGLNGVILWHHEGYISAESLKENIEKAFAALCLQETAATLLSATLLSKDTETTSSSSSSSVAPMEHGIPSNSESPTLTSKAVQETETTLTTAPTVSHQSAEERVNESSNQPHENASYEAPLAAAPTVSRPSAEERVNESSSQVNQFQPHEKASSQRNFTGYAEITENVEEITNFAIKDVNSSGTFSQRDVYTMEQHASDTINVSESTDNLGIPNDTIQEKHEKISSIKTGRLSDCSTVVKSNDVHVNIRMPDGSSIQTKVTMADRLSSVKTFVDENKATQLGSYDLAVPYPRKLFSDQDMTRTLAELGFANREALIVVPHRQAIRPTRNQSLPIDNQTYSNDISGGYFQYVKRFLSYVNPFSYFSGNVSSSEPTTGYRASEYGFDSAVGNQLSSSQSSQNTYSDNHQNPVDRNNARRRTSTPFGSNIHTLRRDEDDDPSDDKNVFWNGNSTQFGGSDK